MRLSRDDVPTRSASKSASSVVQIHTITLVGALIKSVSTAFLTQLTLAPWAFLILSSSWPIFKYLHSFGVYRKPYPKPDQDVSSGELVIMVDEGRIAGIVDANGNQAVALGMAFPFLDGKVLNIRDIEQGLDQMNRLSSNRMKVQLIPQKKSLGYGTIVQVVNHSDAPSLYSSSIQYNNHSDHPVRLYPRGIELLRDNALNLNDQWVLSFSQANGVNGQNSNSASLGCPFRLGIPCCLMGIPNLVSHVIQVVSKF